MLAAVFESDAGAGDEVSDGAGDEDLAGLSVSSHACPGVDRDASHLSIEQLALTGV